MQFKVRPYKMSSTSSRDLARGLECKRIKVEGSRYRHREGNIVINWGNSSPVDYEVLNHPDQVAIACNKLHTFEVLHESAVNHPIFTVDKEKAKEYCISRGDIYCRTILTGNSGQGIIVATTPDEIVDAPLYTVGTRCKNEYRVHVMNGQVIDFVQKKRRHDVEADNAVRSHNNGWIFAREGVELPDAVKQEALAAVVALDLDFGAVDVGHRTRDDVAFVYEVNTAPGLEGTTLQRYIQAFKDNYV